MAQSVKNPPAMWETGSILGLGRSPGGGHGNPLQYASLENPHGQRSLAGYSHGVTKSGTQLKQPSTVYGRDRVFSVFLTPLSDINCLYMLGFSSGLSILSQECFKVKCISFRKFCISNKI